MSAKLFDELDELVRRAAMGDPYSHATATAQDRAHDLVRHLRGLVEGLQSSLRLAEERDAAHRLDLERWDAERRSLIETRAAAEGERDKLLALAAAKLAWPSVKVTGFYVQGADNRVWYAETPEDAVRMAAGIGVNVATPEG